MNAWVQIYDFCSSWNYLKRSRVLNLRRKTEVFFKTTTRDEAGDNLDLSVSLTKFEMGSIIIKAIVLGVSTRKYDLYLSSSQSVNKAVVKRLRS